MCRRHLQCERLHQRSYWIQRQCFLGWTEPGSDLRLVLVSLSSTSAEPLSNKIKTPHSDINCGGKSIDVVYPGYTNLKDENFNDILSSFNCN